MTKREHELEQRREALDDWSWTVELQDESDRAAAVLGAAVLDGYLEELLTAFFLDSRREVRSLLRRPLGTLGARSQAAYCLGLVARNEYSDLRKIGKIRNAFAHDLRRLTFDDSLIRKLCSELIYPNQLIATGRLDGTTASAKSRFVWTVSSTAAHLRESWYRATEERRVERAPTPMRDAQGKLVE